MEDVAKVGNVFLSCNTQWGIVLQKSTKTFGKTTLNDNNVVFNLGRIYYCEFLDKNVGSSGCYTIKKSE